MKIKKRVLLSAFLLTGVMAAGSLQGAFAADNASQTLTATLGTMKKVTTNGGTITSTIDPDTGNLQTAFSPGFRIETNTNSAQNLQLTSLLTYDSGTANAFYGDATTEYIILANQTVKPTLTAVNDIKAGSTDPANNPNAIAYTVTPPSNILGQLTYTWDNTNKRWNASLTHKGKTDTSLTIPAGAAATNTYSGDDEAGSYQATVTLSFV